MISFENSIKHTGRNNTKIKQRLTEIKGRGILANSFYEASTHIILILISDTLLQK